MQLGRRRARAGWRWLPLAIACWGCDGHPPDPRGCKAPPAPQRTFARANVVLVVIDDVGVDKIASYGVHPRPAHTPRLDALAAQGTRFVNAYAEPVCSPTRAAILTGRRPVRTGVGTAIDERVSDLPGSEVTIPEALSAGGDGWTSAAVGKWHLTTLGESALRGPLRQGFDRFDGILANPAQTISEDDAPTNYFSWQNVVDGTVTLRTDYLPSAQADAAVSYLQTLPEPFFLYVAFSLAHAPIHVPPDELWSDADIRDDFGIGDAMIEALDHEIGRVVDAAGDAYVIVVADNGTTDRLVRPPADPDRAKGTVYGGGTRVPLFLKGPGIPVSVDDRLVHATDLFPSVLELAGVPLPEGVALDGTSIVPGPGAGPERQCVIVERFRPNGIPERPSEIAVVSAGHTLVQHADGSEEFFARDPSAPTEGDDLLDESLTRAQRGQLRELRRVLGRDLY